MPKANVTIKADTSQAIRAMKNLKTTWQEASAQLDIFSAGFAAAGEALENLVAVGSRLDTLGDAINGMGDSGEVIYQTLMMTLDGAADGLTVARQATRLLRSDLNLTVEDLNNLFSFAIKKGRAVGLSAEESIRKITDAAIKGNYRAWDEFGIKIEETINRTNGLKVALEQVNKELIVMNETGLIRVASVEERIAKLKNSFTDMLRQSKAFKSGWTTAMIVLEKFAEASGRDFIDNLSVFYKNMDEGLKKNEERLKRQKELLNKYLIEGDLEKVKIVQENINKILNDRKRAYESLIVFQKQIGSNAEKILKNKIEELKRAEENINLTGDAYNEVVKERIELQNILKLMENINQSRDDGLKKTQEMLDVYSRGAERFKSMLDGLERYLRGMTGLNSALSLIGLSLDDIFGTNKNITEEIKKQKNIIKQTIPHIEAARNEIKRIKFLLKNGLYGSDEERLKLLKDLDEQRRILRMTKKEYQEYIWLKQYEQKRAEEEKRLEEERFKYYQEQEKERKTLWEAAIRVKNEAYQFEKQQLDEQIVKYKDLNFLHGELRLRVKALLNEYQQLNNNQSLAAQERRRQILDELNLMKNKIEMQKQEVQQLKEYQKVIKSEAWQTGKRAIEGVSRASLDALMYSNKALKQMGKTRKEIIKEAVAAELKSIAIQETVKAAVTSAEALAASVLAPAQASALWAAAGMHAAAAAAAAAGAKAMGAWDVPKSSTSGGGVGTGSTAPVKGTQTLEPQGKTVNIYITEGVIAGDPDDVAKKLDELMRNAQDRGKI